MSVKRKWLTRLAVSVITLSMLVSIAGCGDTGSGTTSVEKATVNYFSWDNKYIAYELAQKFEETHPNIDIVIHDTNGEFMSNEYLQKAAAAGTMPDIFSVENPDYPIANDWVVDLKPYLDKEENLDIPQNLLDNGTYNGKIIMIPNTIFSFGIMINKDLLAANNIPIPEYTWTVDEYVNIAKKTTKPGSTMGVNEVMSLLKHYPAQANDQLDWAAFNPTTKHYQFSPEWVAAGNIVKDLYVSKVSVYEQIDAIGNPWALEEGSEDQTNMIAARTAKSQELLGEEDTWQAWQKGKIAMWADLNWSAFFDKTSEIYTGFEWDFYPYPSPNEGDAPRTPIMQDSRAISKSCKNPDAAYEYLEYTTYSAQGAADRLEIIKNYDQAKAKEEYPDFAEADLPATAAEIADTGMPVTSDQQVLNEWYEYSGAPEGLKYVMKYLDTSYSDGYKIIPGYNEAYGGTQQKFQEQVLYGAASPADIANDLEAQANAITDEAFAAMVK